MSELTGNPQARKRFLFRRAKRMLERRGLGLKKLQSGGFIVIDGENEEKLAEFKTIEELGPAYGLWGYQIPNEEHPSKDAVTGMQTPHEAALVESLKPPKPPKPKAPAPKVPSPKSKKW